MVRIFAASSLAVLFACVSSPTVAPSGVFRTEEVRPALLEWNVGVNEKDGPSGMVETVLPATYADRDVWRVVHRDPDPTADGAAGSYDMYDLDRATLAPLRSVMSREGFELALTFQADRVKIEKRDGANREVTSVRVRNPMPEGPGMRVLLAALPLEDGFRTSFEIVDRWDEARRVKTIDLTVARADTLATPLGRCQALEVTLAPRDGSFRIRNWVRLTPPHYPLKVEYTRGETVLVSEVTRMVVEGVPVACER